MWVIFGCIAIIATCINLYLYGKDKDYRFAMAMGLSFTALTVVANYRMVSSWVKAGDWAALSDVVPTMEIVLWILTGFSILLNMAPILLKLRNRKSDLD